MGQDSNSGISSDMLASMVEAGVQKAFAEASLQRSSSRRSMYSSSSSDSSSSSSDDSSRRKRRIKKRNSKKGYTLGNSKRSMSSIGLSSMANASSPALSSMGGGMGKRSSTRSRSSLSLDKIGEGTNLCVFYTRILYYYSMKQ